MKHGVMNEKNIWKGAWILTFAAIIVKILSAVYRIPYQNITGDLGFYIYQQVYPIASAVFVLSTYGFPVVLSRMLAGEQNESKQNSILSISILGLSLFGGSVFFILFFCAELIAELMGDVHLALPIKTASFTFLLMPFLSSFRGFFQANQWMTPTATSQIAEQSVRVGVILGLTLILVSNGANVYEAGAAAAFGSVIGAVTSVTVLIFYFRKYFHLFQLNQRYFRRLVRPVLFRLFKQGFLICVSSLFIVFLQLIDSFTVLNTLIRSGIELEQAKVLKGVYDRSLPFIQLGTTLAVSISLTLVPLITNSVKKRDIDATKRYIYLAYRICSSVGLAAAVGLVAIIGPANRMLYENDSGSTALAIAGLSIFSYSVVLTSSAVLQGYGDFVSPVLYIAFGCVLKLLLTVLLSVPFEIIGTALSTLIAFTAVAFFMVRKVSHKSKTQLKDLFLFHKLIIPLFMMAAAVLIYQWLLGQFPLVEEKNRLYWGFIALSGVSIGAIIYLTTLLRSGYFSENELALLPLGSKLQGFLRKKGV
ncbi:polysaccharide biosynthesis protein [Bacillus tianshenii]|nr:polysaccharide biosynthesis protein [Bacillus tianshenii]